MVSYPSGFDFVSTPEHYQYFGNFLNSIDHKFKKAYLGGAIAFILSQ
jgi:hypothetical protein